MTLEFNMRKVIFQAKYVQALALFMAKGDIRYYLNKLLVSPAAEGDSGVYLVASNGHVMLAIHDEMGHTDSSHFVTLSPAVRRACARVRKKNAPQPRWVQYYDESVLVWQGEEEFPAPDFDDMPIVRPGVTCAEHSERVDAKPFDWAKVFASAAKAEGQVEWSSFNCAYLALLEKAHNLLLPGDQFGETSVRNAENGAAIVRWPLAPHVCALIMPMRASSYSIGAALPDWMPAPQPDAEPIVEGDKEDAA